MNRVGFASQNPLESRNRSLTFHGESAILLCGADLWENKREYETFKERQDGGSD